MDPSWPYGGASNFFYQSYGMPYTQQQFDLAAPASTRSRNDEELNTVNYQNTEPGKDDKESSNNRKYDKWTEEQQKLLVKLWADKQDVINSSQSRNAWREIVSEINERCNTSKTIEKCIRKIKHLIDLYKDRKDWNRKQTGGTLRKSPFYDEIDEILGCRDVVTLDHVKETVTVESETSSSSPANSPANSSDKSSNSDSIASEETEKKKTDKKSRNDRKRNKRKRANQNDDDDYFRDAITGLTSQGNRVAESMEKMLEAQTEQMNSMNMFLGNFLKVLTKEK